MAADALRAFLAHEDSPEADAGGVLLADAVHALALLGRVLRGLAS